VLWPEVPRERELIPWFECRYGPGEPVGAALLWRLGAPAPGAPTPHCDAAARPRERG